MITANDIAELEYTLYSDGRAWDFATGSVGNESEANNFVDGLGNNFVDGLGNDFVDGNAKTASPGAANLNARRQIIADVANNASGILDQLFPDNDNFDENDAENYEIEFGIVPAKNATLEDRKKAIYAKYYISEYDYNGTVEYLQQIIQANGFDLYVHANRFIRISGSTRYGSARYGSARYGVKKKGKYNYLAKRPEPGYTSFVSNYVSYEDDLLMSGELSNMFNISAKYQYLLFISGPNYPELADVNSDRMNELRQIILINKKANETAVLYINEI